MVWQPFVQLGPAAGRGQSGFLPDQVFLYEWALLLFGRIRLCHPVRWAATGDTYCRGAGGRGQFVFVQRYRYPGLCRYLDHRYFLCGQNGAGTFYARQQQVGQSAGFGKLNGFIHRLLSDCPPLSLLHRSKTVCKP